MTDRNKSHGLNQWSADDGVRADGVPYRAMSKEMIAEIVAVYGHVAGLCKRAGFEMVMVHAGHGWLPLPIASGIIHCSRCDGDQEQPNLSTGNCHRANQEKNQQLSLFDLN